MQSSVPDLFEDRENLNASPTHLLDPKRARIVILVLGALNTVTPFSIDLYLPAFPEIAGALHTTAAKVSLSVSTYFLGFSLGQMLYGPLLDRFGRKKPLYLGLFAYLVATAACAFAKSIEVLLVLRFLQALGGSVASVASTTLVRDFFPVEKAVKVFSMLMLILSVSPLLAPTIGGFIVSAFGWQSVFAMLALLCALILTTTYFFLPDGRAPDPSVALSPLGIARDFRKILKNRRFFTYSLAGSFSFAGLFVYVAGSPAIFMEGYQVTPKVYGGIFGLLAVGMILGGQLNLWVGKRFSHVQTFKAALITQCLFGCLYFIFAVRDQLTLVSTLIFLFVLLGCTGITYPNAAAIALSPFEKNAGRAAALLGFLQLGLGSVISSVVGLLSFKGSLPTAFVMASSAVIGMGILVHGTTRERLQDSESI